MATYTLNTKVYSSTGFNQQGQSVYKNTASSLPSGFSYLTTSVKTGTGDRASVVRYNLSVPHVATEASACACPGGVIGTDYVRIETQLSSQTSATDRADLYLRLKDLVLSAEFEAAIENLTQSS